MVGFLSYLMTPVLLPVASMALTTRNESESATSPNTTCLPLSHGAVVMKNCQQLLLQVVISNADTPLYDRLVAKTKASHQPRFCEKLTCSIPRLPLRADRDNCASSQSFRHRNSCRR